MNLRTVASLILMAVTPGWGQGAYIQNFRGVTARQKSDVGCWAAGLEITARAANINLSQDEIIEYVKGNAVSLGATFTEISAFLKGRWVGEVGQPGTYTIDSDPFEGAVPAQTLQRYFCIGRPVLLAYRTGPRTGHLVVAHGGEFENGGLQVKTVRVFDVYDGTDTDEEWDTFSRTLIGSWVPTITLKGACRVFGPGYTPPAYCQPRVGTCVATPDATQPATKKMKKRAQ